MTYSKPKAGEEVFPIMDGYKLACCDCGLVHKVDFVVVKVTRRFEDGSWSGPAMSKKTYRVMMQVYRDNRATAAIRRRNARKGTADATGAHGRGEVGHNGQEAGR